jgi:hypothetical protein
MNTKNKDIKYNYKHLAYLKRYLKVGDYLMREGTNALIQVSHIDETYVYLANTLEGFSSFYRFNSPNTFLYVSKEKFEQLFKE